MFLTQIVFSVFACTSVTKYVFVSSEGDDTTERPLENHSFVALIDILFTDETNRVCTGTIIHDKAVITAAHCFLNHANKHKDVELSGSFIVVGTKKMFDTGYESYLPIERVLTHPKYRGWTADLALVYTFAGMATDKPGHVIPIVEENEATPVDSNVTILSWGHYCEEQVKKQTTSKFSSVKKRRCTSSEESNEYCESRKHKSLRQKSISREGEYSGEKGHKATESVATDSKHRSFQGRVNIESTPMVMPSITTSESDEVPTTKNVQTLSQDKDRDRDSSRDSDETKESKETKESNEHIEHHAGYITIEPIQSEETHGTTEVKKPNLAIGSRYLIPAKGKTKKKVTSKKLKVTMRTTPKKRRYEKAYRNASNDTTQEEDTPEKTQDWSKVLETVIQRAGLNKSTDEEKAKQFIERRRSYKLHKHPAVKDNKLTVESFGFVNVQTCKKLIDKALPKLYKINPNEVICYAADDHFISDDDSGAPAIREGRLVAVTLGGVECDGDHVAIGMKMTCYCSWILENLPPGKNTWECCTDCCGEENKDRKIYDADKVDTYIRSSKHKNKSHKRSEEDDE